MKRTARVGLGEVELVSPCCGKPVALFGGAIVEPRAEDVERLHRGEPPAYMTGGVHWCPCGMPWLMRALVPKRAAG